MNRFILLFLFFVLFLSIVSVHSRSSSTGGSSSHRGGSSSGRRSSSSGGSSSGGAANSNCPTVDDGSTPFVDLKHQLDTTQLRANWFFGPPPPPVKGTSGSSSHRGGSSSHRGGSSSHRGGSSSHHGGSSTGRKRLVRGSTGGRTSGLTSGSRTSGHIPAGVFEVAIVSGREAKELKATRCRTTPGFTKADVQDFRPASPQLLIVQNTPVFVWKSGRLNLTKGRGYFVVLKLTDPATGKTYYTNSNGIVVGVNASSTGDDDDEFPPYKAGLIAMGIAIFCLLCLLILLILLVVLLGGKKEDKYGTTVHRNENVDKL